MKPDLGMHRSVWSWSRYRPWIIVSPKLDGTEALILVNLKLEPEKWSFTFQHWTEPEFLIVHLEICCPIGLWLLISP